MKNIGNEIDKILSTRRIKKKDFAINKIGITPTYLSQILKKESIDAELLEKFTKALNVPISFWFDEKADIPKITQTGNGNKSQVGNGNVIIESQANEIEHLRALIEEKDRRLSDKEKLIKILEKQLNK